MAPSDAEGRGGAEATRGRRFLAPLWASASRRSLRLPESGCRRRPLPHANGFGSCWEMRASLNSDRCSSVWGQACMPAFGVWCCPHPQPRPHARAGVWGGRKAPAPNTPSKGSPFPPQWEGGRGDGSHTCPGRWSLACPQNELDPGDSPVDKSRTLRYNAYRLVCHTNQSRTCSDSRSERSGERSTGMDRIRRMMPPYPVHPVYPCSSPSCRRSAPESRRGRADAWVLYTRV